MLCRLLCRVVIVAVVAACLAGCVPRSLPKSADVVWDPVSVDMRGDRDGVPEFDMFLETLVGEYSPVWDCAVMGNTKC